MKTEMMIIKKDFSQYIERINEMKQIAVSLDPADLSFKDTAINLLGEVKKLSSRIEQKRKEIIEEPSDFIKSVNNFCKNFSSLLNEIESVLKTKISEYRKKEEILRAKAQKELTEKYGQLILLGNGNILRGENGTTVHTRKKMSFKIIDESLIPREYLSPDSKKINNAIKLGIWEIPGIEVYEEEITAVRI